MHHSQDEAPYTVIPLKPYSPQLSWKMLLRRFKLLANFYFATNIFNLQNWLITGISINDWFAILDNSEVAIEMLFTNTTKMSCNMLNK